MVLEINHPAIGFDKEDQTFSAELSSLGRGELDRLCWEGSPIFVKNPKTGKQLKMTRFKVDTDASHEDIYGWWYRGFNPENGRAFKFLFIND